MICLQPHRQWPPQVPHRPVWRAAAQRESEPANTIMLIEVKKTAFLHGTTYRHVCVELIEEGERGTGRNVDGSTQEGHVRAPDAPAMWYSEVERTLKEAGSKPSPTTSGVFRNETPNVRVVHVDEVLCTETHTKKSSQIWVEVSMTSCVIKFEIVGAGTQKENEGHFLGRTIR